MKRNIIYSAAAAVMAMLAFAGCSADRDLAAPATGGNTRIVAETDPMASDTRTAVDPTEYESGEIGINWLPTDRIGVFGNAGTMNTPFTNTTASTAARAEFAGNLKDGEMPLYAYYPYRESAGTDMNALKGNLPLEQVYDQYSGSIQGDYKYGIPVEGSTGRFSFRHLFAFLKFDIDATGSTMQNQTLESISLTIPGNDVNLGGDFTFNVTNGDVVMASGTNNTVTMRWKTNPELTPSMFHGYMSVAPANLTGKQLDIEIKTNSHVASFTVSPKVDALERNSYYELPLSLKMIEETNETFKKEERTDVPQAAVVPALESRLACANRVFSFPSTPFMHKIRVADANAEISVTGLPEGLVWNDRRKLVQGQVAAPGEYVYTVTVKSGDSSFSEGVSLTVSSDLHQPTPHMGWQSWNVLEMGISESSIKEVADALVNNGFKDAGYIWLGIDDTWQAKDGSRNSDGMPNVDSSKFPNGLKVVTDYIHSKGMKAGIYSDAGTLTCASGSQAGGTMLGAYGYEDVHAKYFTEWGFDKLKEDWFWGGHGDNNGSLDPNSTTLAHQLYKKMGDGIKTYGNKILLSMCEWGTHEPWKWAPEAGASSWRMSYDHRDGWLGAGNTNSVNSGGIGLKNSIVLMRDLWPYAGVNRFNDPDMLVVGVRGTGTSSNDLVEGVTKSGSSYYTGSFLNRKIYTGMSDAEYETEFAMWCMWSAPLLMTLDVRKTDINAHDLALLKNKELIALNQDPMGQQAEYIKADGNVWYFCKDLANGDVAIAAVNMGDSSATYTITKGDYDALDGNAYTSRDLINRKDGSRLTATAPLRGTLPAHATAVYRLRAE